MTDEQDIIRKAYRVNLLQRLRDGKALSAHERADLLRLSGEDAGQAETWPTLAAVSRDCGLSPARLRTCAGRGCPLEADEAGQIEQVPVWRWLWQHRDDIDRRRAGETESEKLKAERLRLGNEKISGAHLAEATRLASRVLGEAVAGVRRRLGPHILADLRQLDDDAALAGAIVSLMEAASTAALGQGSR